MKKRNLLPMLTALLLCSAVALNVYAQDTLRVDRTKYPDYTGRVYPDWSLMTPTGQEGEAARARARSQRPDHVNNAETRYFPPIFEQVGGSCSAASRICYMFSYELAAYRDLDAKQPENYYPSHFLYLQWATPTGGYIEQRNRVITEIGMPSAADYGGQTYSALFGAQDYDNPEFGWMNGYDKWYRAMHNRMHHPSNFPMNMSTEEGREALKNWLWNHNGDGSFQAGGICGVDVGTADSSMWRKIPQTVTNDAIGVTGMSYVKRWAISMDHSVTIVGYDDRIEFDLDEDGIYGEAEADEVGAWIIANSWGTWWENNGFIYCPYARSGKTCGKNTDDVNPSDWWYPEVYKVNKDYRPLRTIKLEMEYSHRSEIALSAGISADLDATEPEKTVGFMHFTYAGDGNYGNTNPAPATPMLGRWADGKLHDEPMEFGYDLTDLTEGYDMAQPLKYFFIIEARAWAQGTGAIHQASIMDYAYDQLGQETPFIGESMTIEGLNDKNSLVISVIVPGSSYHAPQNPAYTDGTLSWQAPVNSGREIASYNIYYNNSLIGNTAAGTYQPTENATYGDYGISAVYADGNESAKTTVKIPVGQTTPNAGIDLSNSGFDIPDVFKSQHQQATIEYWIKPKSLVDWNQSGGPGWEDGFMFHANANKYLTAGWDTNNRTTTNKALQVGVWTHVAIVVNDSQMTVYLDGENCGTVNSTTYSGLGGFGTLTFRSNGDGNAQNAVYDEIRIWHTARTAEQINACKDIEFTGSILPEGLVAYLKGDLFENESNTYLYDCVGEHHAKIHNAAYASTNENMPTLGTAVTGEPAVSIDAPNTEVYAGIPVALTATYNEHVCQLTWTAPDAGIDNLSAISPAMTFATPGTYTVSVTAATTGGKTATATRQIEVKSAPAVDATFTPTSYNVPAGVRVTFAPNNPRTGYIYQWDMPGADNEATQSTKAAATYLQLGTYDVTLTITGPDGTTDSHTETITVVEVAPKAAFNITPAVVVKGEEVQFIDESLYTPTAWEWNISNGKVTDIVYNRSKTLVMSSPGVYTVTLNAANNAGSDQLTRERALIVTNADSRNGLTFSKDESTVTLTTSPIANGQSEFTIEWWMNSEWPEEDMNGIGESQETLLLKTMGGGRMMLYMGGSSVSSSNDYVIPNEWHHYAVTFDTKEVKFYRDGVLTVTRETASDATVPAIGTFRIGGSDTPLKGSIDEFRVWGKALTLEQLRSYANAPIADVATAGSQLALSLYYQCNQNGGAVQDATSNANHGERTNFGPDGDAWALSKGVFCLNFEENATDITADHLTNYEKWFDYNDTCVNPNLSERTFGLTGWIIENAVTTEVAADTIITTGAHVDLEYWKDHCFTVTTEWDDFASTLSDHKVYQIVTLPAGNYTFAAMFDYEKSCGNSFVVAAQGTTLPTTEDLDQALGYTAMNSNGTNAVSFLLTEETTVSVGLLVNMSGKQCMTIQRFSLSSSPITVHEKTTDSYTLNVTGAGYSTLYLGYDAAIPEGATAWIVTQIAGESLKMQQLSDYIPANTAVIIKAPQGTYTFVETEEEMPAVANNLLSGTLEDTYITPQKAGTKYYVLSNPGGVVGMYRAKMTDGQFFNNANKSYLAIVPSIDIFDEETDTDKEGGQLSVGYRFDFGDGSTLIERSKTGTQHSGIVYDLQGRRVENPTKGLYIVDGRLTIFN